MKTPEYVKEWDSPKKIAESMEEAIRKSDYYGGFIKVSTMFVADVLIPLFKDMTEDDDE